MDCNPGLPPFPHDPFHVLHRHVLMLNTRQEQVMMQVRNPRAIIVSNDMQMAAFHESLARPGPLVPIYHDKYTTELCVQCTATAAHAVLNPSMPTPTSPQTCTIKCWTFTSYVPPDLRRLYLADGNVRMFLRVCNMREYSNVTELALFPSGVWMNSQCSGIRDVDLGRALSAMPSLVSLALGNVYDASIVASACPHLRSLAVYGTAFFTRAAPRLTRFTSIRPVAHNAHGSDMVRFTEALSGTTSLTALRACHLSWSEASNLVLLHVERLPRLQFLVLTPCTRIHVDRAPWEEARLVSKFTNLVGSLYTYRRLANEYAPMESTRFCFSSWLYSCLWLRGEEIIPTVRRREGSASYIAWWVSRRAPGWVFQRVVVALLGWLHRDKDALRFDPAVLAAWL